MTSCYFIYATAPDRMRAGAANDALNAYIADRSRGIPVVHDHFAGAPHGGFVVLFPRTDEEAARLDDPGPLEGWQLCKHRLVFAMTPVGFDAQIGFTLEHYGETSLELLRAAEPRDPRYWWQRTSHES